MIWFVCIFLFVGSCYSSDVRLVETAQGPVKGRKDTDTGIYTFYNIPYAKVPTGADRFKAPLPPTVRTEPLGGVDEGIICLQTDHIGFIPDNKMASEECLIANVFVPDTEEKNLPVVVYIHGGSFFIGWGNILPPKSLVKSNKVVAVTFNYRLGAHGFLCLGTEDIPGNAGLKDQVALLRWVKSNIASFGGNPDEVTIAGYNVGAASVELLMLSKMADGLFNKAILESGSGTAAFAVQSDPIRNAKKYAKKLGFKKVNDRKALEEFFKSLPNEKLNSVSVVNRTDSTFLLAPCVERDLGQEVFLDQSPVNILKSGNFKKIPAMYGFTNMEGIYRVPYFEKWKELMNEKFSKFLPVDLTFENDFVKEEVAENVKRYYFGDKPVEENTILAYVDYFTDIIFAYSVLRSVELQVEASNDQVYLYEYSYFNDNTPEVPHTSMRGANHCDQTLAVLDSKELVDEQHAEDMRELWINFITTGKPVPEGSNFTMWSPVAANFSPYMSLGQSFELKDSPLNERVAFWKKIYDKYYKEPIPPNPPIQRTDL